MRVKVRLKINVPPEDGNLIAETYVGVKNVFC
jgi:hypothetical protein